MCAAARETRQPVIVREVRVSRSKPCRSMSRADPPTGTADPAGFCDLSDDRVREVEVSDLRFELYPPT